MKLEDIEATIQKEIPIVKAMGVKFKNFHDLSATIHVPLSPNHNHKNTAFGGSLYSACTAACYGLMYSLQIKENFHEHDLLIGEGSIRYQRPVDGDFFIKATLTKEDWELFLEKVKATGFGKIPLTAHVYIKNETQQLCCYSAVFVLKRRP